MANVLHSQLTGTDLHETKGASTATVGQVPVANGTGSAPFGFLSYNKLTEAPIVKPFLNGTTPSQIVRMSVYTTTSGASGIFSVAPLGYSAIWAVFATAVDNVETLGVVATVKVATTSAVSGVTVTQAAAANTAKVGVPVQVIVIGI